GHRTRPGVSGLSSHPFACSASRQGQGGAPPPRGRNEGGNMRAHAKGMRWRYLRALGGALLVLVGLFVWQTWAALRPLPLSLLPDAAATRRAQAVDRRGFPLSVTFQNPWNVYDAVSLHDIPRFLQQAFVTAEDKRFYEHKGVDWP